MEHVQNRKASLDKLGLHFNKTRLSDIIVETEDGSRFHCHKIVLAAGSPVFEAMFESDEGSDVPSSREAQERKITIEELESSAVEWVLSAMYTGEGVLTTALVVPIMMVATMYQVDWVSNKCRLFLKRNLSNNTCCIIFNELVGVGGVNRGLKAQFVNYIHNNIASISKMDSFLKLSDDAMEHLASLPTTYDFCLALVKWVEHDFDSRKETGVSLLNDLDFFSLEMEELDRLVELKAFDHMEGIRSNLKQVLHLLEEEQCTDNGVFFSFSRDFLQCHEWEVAHLGWHHIVAVGAKAADLNYGEYRGGLGAIVGGSFLLRAGQVVRILTGSMSTHDANARYTGGGGGTFVFVEDGSLLIAAGGGGGCSKYCGNGSDVNLGEDGKGSPDRIFEGGTRGRRAKRGGCGWLDGISVLLSSDCLVFGGGSTRGGGGGYSGGAEDGCFGGGGGGGSYIAPHARNFWKKVGGKGHGCVSIWNCTNKPTNRSFDDWLVGHSE